MECNPCHVGDSYPPQIMDKGLHKIMDSLKLDNNIIGCRLTDLEGKCSRARPEVLGSSLECGIVDVHC